MALVKGYRFTWGGGGPIFRPKPPVFDRSWRSPSKNTVKNSTEDTCSWTRPSKNRQAKSEKNRVFQLFDLNFLVCNIFFCGSAGGRARRRIFEFLDPFSDWFSSFCDSRNTGFYSVFLFSACLTASFKTSKNLVNYAVLCYGVNENIVNTSVFWRWLKNTVNYSVFGHLTLKNHGICSGFCFSPRKNTVNNSNFAVFSCFSLFFELRWSAIHGYQILRVFFSDNQYFRMFLVSMADIIGSYERLPNDAVRAVAVAKRREYTDNRKAEKTAKRKCENQVSSGIITAAESTESEGVLLNRSNKCQQWLQNVAASSWSLWPIPEQLESQASELKGELWRWPGDLTVSEDQELTDIQTKPGLKLCHTTHTATSIKQNRNITGTIMDPWTTPRPLQALVKVHRWEQCQLHSLLLSHLRAPAPHDAVRCFGTKP